MNSTEALGLLRHRLNSTGPHWYFDGNDAGPLPLSEQQWEALDAYVELERAVARAEISEQCYQSWRFDNAQSGGWREEDVPDLELISKLRADAAEMVARLVAVVAEGADE